MRVDERCLCGGEQLQDFADGRRRMGHSTDDKKTRNRDIYAIVEGLLRYK